MRKTYVLLALMALAIGAVALSEGTIKTTRIGVVCQTPDGDFTTFTPQDGADGDPCTANPAMAK